MRCSPGARMTLLKMLQGVERIKAGCTAAVLLLLACQLIFPNKALATDTSQGEVLFQQHCVGCHLNGGNIIRRGRTLKLAALERNQLNNQEAIARIAREGIGQMSGYENVLGENGDELVAAWVLMQAKDSWPR